MTSSRSIARSQRVRALTVGFGVVGALMAASVAFAHTETDVVAVPAGEEAAVIFRPQHGCGDSPTIAVLVRAPVADAVAEDVDGWQATSTPDGDGKTVLEWSGGSLATDRPGAFPVEFISPDTVGDLLTFPAVQRCENGEELAWISGDPAAEFPAPRLLILAPGSEPAATIDDVPLDAPGRDQLVAIVDIDNPATSVTTTAPGAESTIATTIGGTTSEPTTVAQAETTAADTVASTPSVSATPGTSVTDDSTVLTADGDNGDGGSNATVWVIVGAVIVAAAAAAAVAWRRRAA